LESFLTSGWRLKNGERRDRKRLGDRLGGSENDHQPRARMKTLPILIHIQALLMNRGIQIGE
jgi:hypothetical protein